MKTVTTLGIGALSLAVAASASAGITSVGPDVIVGDLPNVSNYNAVGGMNAYSVGTTSCNIGDEELLWISNINQHPVIGQNLYRYHNGVMMQVGQSWLKHGFFALSGSLCDSCQGTAGSTLGVGCSDPYGSGLNGSQGGLGPRFEVNAYTGAYPYPFSNPQGSSGNSIFKRLQVPLVDVLPSEVPGAIFYIEGQYVTPDDAAAQNHYNNASYRRVNMSSNGNITITGSFQTVREQPAIMAWAAVDPDATVVPMDVQNEGRFHLGTKVIDNGDGTWTYHYAVHNLNSDRSIGSVSVNIPNGVNVTDIGFHDVHYHSGEPFDGTDWPGAVSGGTLTWATDSFAQNANANAIRWGTMYNFWYTADAAPELTSANFGLFKPGGIGSVDSIRGRVPTPMGASICLGDCDGSGTIDFNDLVEMLFAFGPNSGDACDTDESGAVDFNDLVATLFLFGPCN
ncbi:unnamed protein product [Symbiodinium necroappetens]|uniref:EF-hand domain-containing protein n=1 Tax=Symbiodinium necroappetens TaxID=1628268 RepID=A0A812U2Z1_9DINO|nr:unnamed protein product [Symbiodinium necroappetens]